MKKHNIVNNYSRRSVIKTLGITAAAPFIPVLHAEAAVGDGPKRLLIVTTPNGLGDGATPTKPGADYVNGSAFGALNKHKKDINIFRGIDFKAYNTDAFKVTNSHPALAPHLLTAAVTERANASEDANSQTAVYHSKGKSIDQVISQRLMAEDATKTAMPFIYAGVKTGRGSFYHQVYSRAGASLYPQVNAQTLHSQIFDGSDAGSGGDVALQRRLAERRSVIDNATAEINAVMRVLSNVDKQKMQDHLDAVRQLEQQLAFEESNTGAIACMPPTLKTETGAQDERFQIDGENMMDMIVQGFACDRTRVATLMWSNSANGIKFTSKGLTEGHHSYTHSNIFSQAKKDARNKITQWYAERFDYLIQKMKSIPEAGGTMLDNTLIIWTCEHSNDRGEHDRRNIPYITAGSAGGTIKTGNFFDFSSDRRGHGDMYVTAAHAMGLTDINRFGIPEASKGVLPGVLV